MAEPLDALPARCVCSGQAERLCFLLNRDFLLNSLQHLSCIGLKAPGRSQGRSQHNIFILLSRVLRAAGDTGRGGQGSPGG